MKKHIYVLIVSCFSVLNFSFGQEKSMQLQRKDTIHKTIRLSFNQTAVKQNEYVIFEINDDFDFKNLVLLIDDKEYKEKTFKVYATQGTVLKTIKITPKPDANSGNYNFNTRVLESSNILEGNISYKKNNTFKTSGFTVPESSKEKFIKYGIAALIGLAAFFLLLFIIRQRQKFRRGILSLKHPHIDEFYLKNYARKFSYKEVVDKDTSTDFYLIKGRNGNPKIYASKSDVMIEVNNEVVADGYLLRMEDEVRVSDDNNNYIKFIYN